MKSTDSSGRFAAARAAMVESQLRPQGITDQSVIAAFATIGRERFVPEASRALSYSDRSVPLGEGRALMPPAALAALIQAIEPVSGERALVVGAGSGYSAAVLAHLGMKVTAIDPSPALVALAAANRVSVIDGKLTAGHADGAPYDVILIDGAVNAIPDKLVAQLADGGRLAAAVGAGSVARLVIGTRSGDAFGVRSIGDASVPALPGFTRPRAFAFPE